MAALVSSPFSAIKYIAHKINDSGASGKCVIVVPRARFDKSPKRARQKLRKQNTKKKTFTLFAFPSYFVDSHRYSRMNSSSIIARQKSFMTNSNLSVKY
jgi:hypothetical protein